MVSLSCLRYSWEQREEIGSTPKSGLCPHGAYNLVEKTRVKHMTPKEKARQSVFHITLGILMPSLIGISHTVNRANCGSSGRRSLPDAVIPVQMEARGWEGRQSCGGQVGRGERGQRVQHKQSYWSPKAKGQVVLSLEGPSSIFSKT